MTETILVLNSGSSSIKFQLFEVAARDRLERRMKGLIDGIGARPRFAANGMSGERLVDEVWPAGSMCTVPAALARLVTFLREQIGERLPTAIGHRVVHGGPTYAAPTIVTEAALDQLQRLVPLAPLHQPNNLAPIRAILAHLPNLPQVACFDTAFHRGHTEVADRFAIPEQLHSEGVRRYGFHGLSYEYIAGQLREEAPEIAGGIDGLVFTAGIGENASVIREAVVRRLTWLGLELDPAANAGGGPRISRQASRVACYVIPTDEELMIARHTLDVLRGHAGASLEERQARCVLR